MSICPNLPGHTHREKEKSDGKSSKSIASRAIVMKHIEGEDKLLADPLTAILASLDHFYGIYGDGTVGFRLGSLPLFLIVSTTQNLKRR